MRGLKLILIMILSLCYWEICSLDGDLQKQMYRAACIGDKTVNLQPHQDRETLVVLMKKAGYGIPAKLRMLAFMRKVFVGVYYTSKLSPIASGALSYYFASQGQTLPGLVSMFSTVVIIPIQEYCKNAISWVEDGHRDALLQKLDLESIKEFGAKGNRDKFIDLLFEKNKNLATGSSDSDDYTLIH